MRTPKLSGEVCLRFSIFLGISSFVTSIYADILLTFRLYYMYSRDRRLLGFSLALYLAVITTSVALSSTNFPSAGDFTSSDGGSCFVRLTWELPVAWLLGLGYHVYLAVLALAKVRQAYAHRNLLGVRLSLLALLVQGNLEYYTIIVAAYCVMTVLTFLGPSEIGSYNLITITTMGFFGPKLFRDMRRMLAPTGQDPTFSSVLFASRQTLNIADEVEFVWKRNKSWYTLAYILAKFITLTGLVVDGFARMRGGYDDSEHLCTLCGHCRGHFGPDHVMLISRHVHCAKNVARPNCIRLYFMYDCNRRILWLALGLYGCLTVVSGFLTGIKEPSSISVKGGRCINAIPVVKLPPVLWLAYHVFLALLAFAKVRQAHTRDKLLRPRVSILTLLVHGNIIYYAMTCPGLAVMVIFAFTGHTQVTNAYYLLSSVAFSIFATRLFREMRRMLAPGGRDPTFSHTTTFPQ
ncbi:hypothetical protein AURDEDRAFT_183325 [Auricularia subglabra TFB-10046 SS5]|nr:hypothetical protein AURDEDRAFT_183325 [Auricularia subglabra TFB-10046 SS5]